MIPFINNAIDILWLLAGLIAVVVLLAMYLPWSFVCELIALTLLVILIALKFWLREGWHSIKRILRRKRRWVHIDDHDLFI